MNIENVGFRGVEPVEGDVELYTRPRAMKRKMRTAELSCGNGAENCETNSGERERTSAEQRIEDGKGKWRVSRAIQTTELAGTTTGKKKGNPYTLARGPTDGHK